VHDLDSYGVKVRSMTEPFDTSDASGRFLLTILAGVADLERSNILQRMNLGRLRSAKNGKWISGTPPYGYEVDEEGYLTVNENPIPNIDMTVADVVRQIFDLIVSGNSLKQTADKLNALGIPTFYSIYEYKTATKKKRSVAKWRVDNVYRIVTNPTYKGECIYTQKGEEPIVTESPAIVSAEVWDKAQIVLKSNKKMMKGNVKRKYLLRGLIKCEHCGYSYSGAYTGKHNYYVDIGRNSWRYYKMDKPCFGKSIHCEWLDNAVWNKCLEYIRNPKLVVKSINGSIYDSEKIEREIDLIHSKIASNATEKQRLIDLYKKGFISMKDVSSEFEKVETEKGILESELKKAESQQRKDDLLRQRDTAQNLLDILREKVDTPNISFELKQTVIQTMVERITINSMANEPIITIHFKFGDAPSFDFAKIPVHLRKSDRQQNYWKISTTITKH
jgi:site-specific DNA recombinase